ncbi:hypothetical protein E4U43_004448, partial [Claviceps pusilla]
VGPATDAEMNNRRKHQITHLDRARASLPRQPHRLAHSVINFPAPSRSGLGAGTITLSQLRGAQRAAIVDKQCVYGVRDSGPCLRGSSSRKPYLENRKLPRDSLPPERWAACKSTVPPPCCFQFCLAPEQGLWCARLCHDDLMLAYFCSDDIVESIRAEGFDPDELFDVYVKAHYDCIAG